MVVVPGAEQPEAWKAEGRSGGHIPPVEAGWLFFLRAVGGKR